MRLVIADMMIRKKGADPWIRKGIDETRNFHSHIERECPETDQCFPRAGGPREMLILSRDTPDATRE